MLHAAVFLGFELAYSDDRDTFPMSKPRTITIVSINTSIDETNINKTVQNSSEVSKETSPPSQKPVKQTQTSEVSTDNNKDNAGLKKQPVSVEDNSLGKEGPASERLVRIDPVPVKDIVPVYPFRARKKGYEGEVFLNVIVSKEGVPLSCRIVKTSGYEDLDKAARETVLASMFYPGTVNGEAAKSNLQIHIRFKLK